MNKNRTMSFSEILDSLVHYYKTTVNVPKSKRKYEYNGPDTTSNSILVTSPSVKEALGKEEFEFRTEYRDTEPIENY
jgi:hypothetical protein